jgi:hypothetical protein
MGPQSVIIFSCWRQRPCVAAAVGRRRGAEPERGDPEGTRSPRVHRHHAMPDLHVPHRRERGHHLRQDPVQPLHQHPDAPLHRLRPDPDALRGRGNHIHEGAQPAARLGRCSRRCRAKATTTTTTTSTTSYATTSGRASRLTSKTKSTRRSTCRTSGTAAAAGSSMTSTPTSPGSSTSRGTGVS